MFRYVRSLLPGLALLAGCSGFLNPYEEDFACPYLEEGACQSATTAYQKSLHEDSSPQNTSKKEKLSPDTEIGYLPQIARQRTEASPYSRMSSSVRLIRYEPVKRQTQSSNDPLRDAKETYQTLTYKRLNSLLGQPETPMIAPPEVIRVLLLPRVGGDDKNQITMARYRYLIVKPSRWVLKDPFEEIGE